MNVQSRYPTTTDEFLRWNEGREGKREFVRGKVVEMMINVSRAHFFLAARLNQQIVSVLGLEEYIVGSSDFGVLTHDGVRFPDLLVERAGGGLKLHATTSPLLIGEILSPSSMADDFGPKARDYLGIPGLLHYLVASQDEVAVWIWTRTGDGWDGPVLHRDSAEPVPLTHLGVTLDLGRLYAGIAPRA